MSNMVVRGQQIDRQGSVRTIDDPPGALTGYRVLDLASGGYAMCGRVLADLGADVLKIEPVGGDHSRHLPPFLGQSTDPEKSLFWFFVNAGKRSITLDYSREEGSRILRMLVSTADFVIESCQPGYLPSLGLGFAELSKINPGLILTSITPYGQDGPKAAYAAGDLTIWASAGPLFITGDPDREPVDLGIHFDATYNAGVEGAVASLVALSERHASGLGEHVDVSAQAACVQLLMNYPDLWTGMGVNTKRVGPYWPTGTGIPRRLIFPCRDGFVCFTVQGGTPGIAASMNPLVAWMKDEGFASDLILNFDWERDYDAATITKEETERLEAPFTEFFKSNTKEELFEVAARRNVFLAPVYSLPEVISMEQLRVRDFFKPINHPELQTDIPYPASCMSMSETPCTVRRRAPLIGEHNEEILSGELGLAKDEVDKLKAAGVV